jgi:transposase
MAIIMGTKSQFKFDCLYVCIIILTIAARYANNIRMKILSTLKKKALLASRTLNPDPEAVRGELFQKDFFDPHDRAQVKYEMLRSHSMDKRTVTEVCRKFGFSRESFYRIREAFKQLGFSSLLPAKTGRKGPTKLKGELLKFILEKKKQQPDIDPGHLAALVAQRYGVHVHRTTVMRAMKKKPHSPAKARRIRRRRRPGADDL